MNPERKITLEVCCASADDAAEAAAAGADRVELNSALFLGGLTPSIGELLTARRHAGIPIMAMVRPREGGFCYSQREFETALRDARALLDGGADGIVFGFLREDGTVDEDRCRAMLDVAGARQSVFHRAIDVTPDWRAAIEALCRLGVTRVLTSGQRPTVPEGAGTLREMIAFAAERIEILPGGGVREENAAWVLRQTGCDQLHVSMRRACRDGSVRANPSIHFGGALYPSEEEYRITDRRQVARLRDLLGAGPFE